MCYSHSPATCKFLQSAGHTLTALYSTHNSSDESDSSTPGIRSSAQTCTTTHSGAALHSHENIPLAAVLPVSDARPARQHARVKMIARMRSPPGPACHARHRFRKIVQTDSGRLALLTPRECGKCRFHRFGRHRVGRSERNYFNFVVIGGVGRG